jgi:hypothetical protein
LALPVSRTRMTAVRICMGLAQAVALAVIPGSRCYPLVASSENRIRFHRLPTS